MKTKTKIGLGFILSGAALQFISETQIVNTVAFGLLIIGVIIEIIGYAFEDKPKNKDYN